MSGRDLQKGLIFAVALSLLTSENCLFRPQKFPVPVRREFDCNRLNFPANRKRRSLPRARIFKIPCYFPCYQGIWVLRRVRFGTASATTQSYELSLNLGDDRGQAAAA